ncbi:GspE/PulE family protein [Candidatus Gracilibacteria bacterium]|nr:GspE/PulE family protein [Candidatus Gracilibacteria bacterium]
MGESNQAVFLGQINREAEEREAKQKAGKLGLGYVDLAKFPPDFDVLKLVSREIAQEGKLFPLKKVGEVLSLAVINPEAPSTLEALEKLKEKKYELQLFVCSNFGWEQAMSWYDSELMQKEIVRKKTELKEKSNQNLTSKLKDLSELEGKIANMQAESALGEIELAAISTKASDIHFQPVENGVTLRFRVDGILHNVLHLEKEVAHKIVTRIKYEAGVQSNIADVPQDGHLSFQVNERKIDLRVSTLPTPFGESIEMRVLDASRAIKTFTELGFSAGIQKKLTVALQDKNGLILVTGPTGSGKTTTLYSMLATLNNPEKKIVTLEDPIEYQLEGISQSQVNEDKKYNFETGLKSLLRHDPDVVLVGEVRTPETARLAAEAALTGHIVLSSLHTNSAVGVVSRLRNLGLENYNIAPTVNAVFAQRLVRKICPSCNEEVNLPQDDKFKKALDRLMQVFPDLKIPTKVKKAKGCEKCSDTGYMGRTAICEAFLLNDEVRKMILEQKSEIDILQFLKEQHQFLTLFEDGVLKVLQNETTLDELLRVTN